MSGEVTRHARYEFRFYGIYLFIATCGLSVSFLFHIEGKLFLKIIQKKLKNNEQIVIIFTLTKSAWE